MNILLLTQVLPYPPDSGPKVKTWNVLKYLVRRHAVTLASFVRGDQSRECDHLRGICRAVHTVPMQRSLARDGLALLTSLTTGRPWMMARDDAAGMRALVDRLAAQTPFAVVHADQLNMAQYAVRVRGARTVLDAHNALWVLYRRLAGTMAPGPRRWLLERDWRLLKRYEGRLVREFDATLAVSDQDRAALREAAGVPRPVAVIPIAVDVDELPVVGRPAGADRLLHIGTMYWPPNVDGLWWFIRQVLPIIRVARPQVQLDLVGARPPAELQALHGAGAGVNVPGYVADPTPYLEQAGAFIVPLRAGGGMRVKILEALARGLPLVTTSIGCEGIAVEHGRHALIADTPEAFARETVRVLQDRALADQLGRAGRALVEARYDYRAACAPLDGLYRPAAA